ncbi:hypothetical protein T10_2041 [Trichinella papuae]|uniref:Uncharacterized protein n=1 Tax=Trichinella papuae TaxID=268474 RepID=A0A0V1MYI2_9BILA|nr:hypothetical protein T10_2041 [Trichinella papuae]
MKICGQIKRERFMIPVRNWNFGFDRYDLFSFWPCADKIISYSSALFTVCCKVEKRGCNYYLPQIPEIAFLNTGLLHAGAWLPFGYPVITGLAVVTTTAAAAAARSLRKYAKHAGSCFIQCCVFVVRRSNVAAGACVFFTLCTSLRKRQGGIFRCQKGGVSSAVCVCMRNVCCDDHASQADRLFAHLVILTFSSVYKAKTLSSRQASQYSSEIGCILACMLTCLLTVVVVVVWPAMITCRYVRWLINLLPLQLPRASKRSVKRSIQPFRQYPLQEMFEARSSCPERKRARHFYSDKQVTSAMAAALVGSSLSLACSLVGDWSIGLVSLRSPANTANAVDASAFFARPALRAHARLLPL